MSTGERVVLLGLSFGGAVLASFAARFPGRVAGLVAGCPWVQHLGPKLRKVDILLNLWPGGGCAQWKALCFRWLVLPLLRSRIDALAQDSAAAEQAGVNLGEVGRLMLAQFEVKGTERDFLTMVGRHPHMPGAHKGGDLLWEAWETIAKGQTPVEFIYALDDEDIPLEDSKRLHGLLMVKRAMSLRNRDAHCGVLR